MKVMFEILKVSSGQETPTAAHNGLIIRPTKKWSIEEVKECMDKRRVQ